MNTFLANICVTFAISAPNGPSLSKFLTCTGATLTLAPVGADEFLVFGRVRIGALREEVLVALRVDVALAHVPDLVFRTFALPAGGVVALIAGESFALICIACNS